MSRCELDAIFEQGVFRPFDLRNLHLADGDKVRIVVEPIDSTPSQTPEEILQMATSVYEGLATDEIDEIERIALDRSRFFEDRDLNESS